MKSPLSFTNVLNSNNQIISEHTLGQIVQQYQRYPENQYIISFANNHQSKHQRQQSIHKFQQFQPQFDDWIASQPHLKHQKQQKNVNKKQNIAPQLLKYAGSKKNLLSNKNFGSKEKDRKEMKKGKNMAELCRQYSENELINTKAVWKCKPEEKKNNIYNNESVDYEQQHSQQYKKNPTPQTQKLENLKSHWISQQKEKLFHQVKQLAQNVLTQQKKNQFKGQQSLLMDNDSMPVNNAWQATKNQISEYLKLKKETKLKQQSQINECGQINTNRQSFSAVGYSFAHDIIGNKSGSNKSKQKIQKEQNAENDQKEVTKFQGLENEGVKIPNVNSVQSQQACGSKSLFGTKKRLSQSNNQYSIQSIQYQIQATDQPNSHMAHYLLKQQKKIVQKNHEVSEVKIVESKLVINEEQMNSQMICLRMGKNDNMANDEKQQKMTFSKETKKQAKKIIVVRHDSRLIQDKKSENPLMFKKQAQKQNQMAKIRLSSQSKQNMGPPNKLIEKPKGLKVQTISSKNKQINNSLKTVQTKTKRSQSIGSKNSHGIRTSLKKNQGVQNSVASSKDFKFDIELQ